MINCNYYNSCYFDYNFVYFFGVTQSNEKSSSPPVPHERKLRPLEDHVILYYGNYDRFFNITRFHQFHTREIEFSFWRSRTFLRVL